MKKKELQYRQDVAFINREVELADLKTFVNKRPAEILFIHGPKSSGKTTLLYKFLEQIQKEQKLDVKFVNLRKIYTEFPDDYNYKEFLFKVMEKEFITLANKGIKPVLIIDELQALDKIYLNNGKDRRLIVEFFNFFVAMTKESHLAHIIVASSDGYFLNTVHNDSKLKKCSEFYKVDYLEKDDVMEWLLNLEKYSNIKDYTLTEEDAEKIWDTLGGSMWEIQNILGKLFDTPIDEVLTNYKQRMQGIITDYIVTIGRKEREKLLRHFISHDFLFKKDIDETDEELLKEMVRNNVLYFDPTRAVYYPQGKSYQWGIRLYFESLKGKARAKMEK